MQWQPYNQPYGGVYPKTIHGPVQVPGGPFVYASAQPDFRPSLTKYPRKTSTILGVLQLVCGIGSVVLGGIAFSIRPIGYEISTGIWVGVLGIITGILGIVTYSRNSIFLLSFLIFSAMLSAGAAGAGIIFDSIFTAFDNDRPYYEVLDWSEEDYYYANRSRMLVIDSFLLITAVILGITALWSSGIACHFCCACRCCARCCCPWLSEEKKTGLYYGTTSAGVTSYPQVHATPHYPDYRNNYYQAPNPKVYNGGPGFQYWPNQNY